MLPWLLPMLMGCPSLKALPQDQPCLEAGYAIARRTFECTGDGDLANARYELFEAEYTWLMNRQGVQQPYLARYDAERHTAIVLDEPSAKLVGRCKVSLQAAYGESYRDYMQRVPRWLPNPRLWQEPTTIEVQPRFLYLTLRDVGWILLLYPLNEGFDWLQESGMVSILLQLP